MKSHPRFASRRGVGTVSYSCQQLSHASDSQGPQPLSGAQTLTRSIRASSPGLSWSHRGSHSSDPHPFHQGVLTWPLLVSPGVSHSDPHPFHQGVLTWPLLVSPGVSHSDPHPFHQGVLTALPYPVSLGVSPPGSWRCPRSCTKPVTREVHCRPCWSARKQNAQARQLLPPTGVGRRRGWRDGRWGAAAP